MSSLRFTQRLFFQQAAADDLCNPFIQEKEIFALALKNTSRFTLAERCNILEGISRAWEEAVTPEETARIAYQMKLVTQMNWFNDDLALIMVESSKAAAVFLRKSDIVIAELEDAAKNFPALADAVQSGKKVPMRVVL